MHNDLSIDNPGNKFTLEQIKSWVVVRDGVHYQPEHPDRKAHRGQPKHFSSYEVACRIREEHGFDDVDFIEDPSTLSIITENIPVETKQYPHWVLWRWMLEFEKQSCLFEWRKIPFQPNNADRRAAPNRPNEWSEFQAAYDVYNSDRNKWAGLWFSLGSLFVGLDIDDFVSLSEEDRARAVTDLKTLNTYTEVSPSATGVHALAKGHLLAGFRNRNAQLNYEIYKDGRFFSFTGRVISNTRQIEERQAEIYSLHSQRFPAKPVYSPIDGKSSYLSDDQVIDKLRNARNADKFKKLWSGDYCDFGGDKSSADFAFCRMVGFYTQSPTQIERIVTKSGLMRDKWDRADYAQRTIDRALRSLTTIYQSRNPSSVRSGGR